MVREPTALGPNGKPGSPTSVAFCPWTQADMENAKDGSNVHAHCTRSRPIRPPRCGGIAFFRCKARASDYLMEFIGLYARGLLIAIGSSPSGNNFHKEAD